MEGSQLEGCVVSEQGGKPWEGQDSGTAAEELAAAKAAFFREHGAEYGYPVGAVGPPRIDELYASEIVPRLAPGEHYLDYTGSSLHWNSQIKAAMEELAATAYGNPHSITPSSARTSQAVEEVRRELLRFFNADPKEYELVFTRSATGALQLVGELFPWAPASHFAYLQGNHKSVLGIREYAARGGASIHALTEEEVAAWVAGDSPQPPHMVPTNGQSGWHVGDCSPSLAELCGGGGGAPAYSLFGYPALDNFDGRMQPLEWVEAVQAKSTRWHKWKVLLDTAAFAPTHPLDLSAVKADFCCLSFYKLFGYPTGVGALIMRTTDAEILKKIYWGGGSAYYATSGVDWNDLVQGPEKFEDGTLPFLDIVALRHGLRVYEELGGPAAIERHTACLIAHLYREASCLLHSNGAPLLRISGKHAEPDRRRKQGATLTFSILDPAGRYHSWLAAAEAMSAAGLHVRSGGMCNPGQAYAAVGVTEAEVVQLLRQKGGMSPSGRPWEWIVVSRPTAAAPAGNGGSTELVRLPLGALRVSLGYMSRFEDVHALLLFLRRYIDREARPEEWPESDVVRLNGGGASASSGGAAGGRGTSMLHRLWCCCGADGSERRVAAD